MVWDGEHRLPCEAEPLQLHCRRDHRKRLARADDVGEQRVGRLQDAPDARLLVSVQLDRPTRARQRQVAEVATGKVHPSKYFYSYEQWNRRIGELVDRYNAEPQQGHMLAGLSPEQAFEAHLNPENPPIQFSAALRYRLANDKRRAIVTLNGVTIQIGKQKFNYRGREIAHLVGREVFTWFDPENPEIITITNFDQTNPICVARSENPNALESLIAPESGTLGRELARIEGQAAHMKTRFNVVKAKFPLPQRKLLADAQAIELGEEINIQKAALTERTMRHQRQRGQAQRLARDTGLDLPVTGIERLTSEQVGKLRNLMNDDSASGGEPPKSLTEENGKFVYHLKTSGQEKISYVNFLLGRLTKFRLAGTSFGQKIHGEITFGTVKKIAASQLNCNLYDANRFKEVCAYLKAKIDATILGKRNLANGTQNYHEFLQTQEAQ